MLIKLPAAQREDVKAALVARLAQSRFTARVFLDYHPRYRAVIRIETVRLRHAKDYCGQHPGPCLVERPGRKQRGTWLEGACWVGFNDMVNGVLDELQLAADVWSYNREAGSGRFFIRKGRCRRVYYEEAWTNNGLREVRRWERDGRHEDYVDYCGRTAPCAAYPEGTPGLADWRPEAEEVAYGLYG